MTIIVKKKVFISSEPTGGDDEVNILWEYSDSVV